jgi:nucleotide-binding universal stress UspA family protein
MFHHILVPLDGSFRAEQALSVAARLVRASGGTLTLLKVVTAPLDMDLRPVQLARRAELAQEADIARAQEYLAQVSSSHDLKGIDVRTEALTGTPARAILLFAQLQSVDLLVMCSHGTTGFKRWLLGGVAEKVAHYATFPVLLLHEGGPALVGTPPHAEGPLRALVPLDGSAQAKAALVPAAQLVASLAAPGPGELHLTRVVAPSGVEQLSQSEREAVMHKAKQYLKNTVEHMHTGLVAGPVANLKLAITWSVSIDDDIAGGIIRTAEGGGGMEDVGVSGSSDLIAMSTHGYSGLQSWAMGSITKRVLHASRLPLLIVRPQASLEKGQQAQEKATISEGEQ